MHLKLRLQLFLQLPLQVLLPLLLPFGELQKKSRTATSWKFYSVSDSSCRRVTFYSYKNLIYHILVLFQGQNEHTEDCSYCITAVDSILCLNISIRLQPSEGGITNYLGSWPMRDPPVPYQTRPEIFLSLSPNHDLVQKYLYPAVPTTISSRVIFIFQ